MKSKPIRPKPRPTYKGQQVTIVFDLPKALWVDLQREAEDNKEDIGQMLYKILERRQAIKDLHQSMSTSARTQE